MNITASDLQAAYDLACEQLNRWGAITVKHKWLMVDALDCEPWELDNALRDPNITTWNVNGSYSFGMGTHIARPI